MIFESNKHTLKAGKERQVLFQDQLVSANFPHILQEEKYVCCCCFIVFCFLFSNLTFICFLVHGASKRESTLGGCFCFQKRAILAV